MKTSVNVRSGLVAAAIAAIALGGCDGEGGDSDDEVAVAVEQAFPGETGTRAHATVAGRNFEVEVVDGWAVAEGDIILGRASEVLGGGGARTGTRTNPDARWATGFVPYTIDPGFSATQKTSIQSAIDHWNGSTVYYLYPRTNEGDYVAFVKGTGCSSPVGRQGGRQEIRLASGCGRGATIHEIGHSVGLWHEQSRDDRDAHVKVNWANIEDGKDGNFKTWVEDGNDGQSPWAFDFGSIMLYDSYAFSKNTKPTLTRTDGTTFSAQRSALSTLDINGATRFLTHIVGQNLAFEIRTGADECLSTLGDARVANTGLIARPCEGSLFQRFYWFKLPSVSELRLVHYQSGMCMDIPNASTQSGAAAQIYPCHGYDNQAFSFEAAAVAHTYVMKLRHSGKCLARSATGAVVQQTCNAQDAKQQWRLVPKI